METFVGMYTLPPISIRSLNKLSLRNHWLRRPPPGFHTDGGRSAGRYSSAWDEELSRCGSDDQRGRYVYF